MAARNVICSMGIAFVFICMSSTQAWASQGLFLGSEGHQLGKDSFYDGVVNAAGAMLGCGPPAQESKVSKIKNYLEPMWIGLPKVNGRIDRRSLRHLVYRYFMNSYSVMVRGFEPARSINQSHWGVADILSERVPAYVESTLESKQALKAGFSLEDATSVVATLDRLMFDSEALVLENVYKEQGIQLHQRLDIEGLVRVLEQFIVEWLVDADAEEWKILRSNLTLKEEIIPNYQELVSFLAGMIKGFRFQAQRQPIVHYQSLWDSRYSFTDAHEILGGITRSFQSYWHGECTTMKESLMAMDSHLTGRVPLAQFYGKGVDTDWRFGESEIYLRELGALDETSPWRGAQVIIPNYVQGTSNCFVNAQYYRICCPNDCESYFQEIERVASDGLVHSGTIVDIVRNISAVVDEDAVVHLDDSLVSQLEQIAIRHGGIVPLHGRLFAQWLHYVFPHDCSFPHKVGRVSLAAPSEYGEHFIASEEVMRELAVGANLSSVNASLNKDDLQWMSQWSPEEELLIDDVSTFRMSQCLHVLLLGALGFILAAFKLYVDAHGGRTSSKATAHSHWV